MMHLPVTSADTNNPLKELLTHLQQLNRTEAVPALKLKFDERIRVVH